MLIIMDVLVLLLFKEKKRLLVDYTVLWYLCFNDLGIKTFLFVNCRDEE